MKKIITMLLTLCLSLSTTISFVFAQDSTASKDIITSNQNQQYYDSLGNYDNQETGEYFHWNPNTKGSVRNFEFKVRYTLKGPYFKLGGTNVQIKLNRVYFAHELGQEKSCCSNHKFYVNLRRDGLSNNISNCIAPISRNGEVKFLGSGFSTSANYLLEIVNVDKLPNSVYIVGSGSVNSYI